MALGNAESKLENEVLKSLVQMVAQAEARERNRNTSCKEATTEEHQWNEYKFDNWIKKEFKVHEKSNVRNWSRVRAVGNETDLGVSQ